MLGHIIGTVIAIFVASFTIGTGVMVVKELIARKRANASDQNKSDEKEADDSNCYRSRSPSFDSRKELRA